MSIRINKWLGYALTDYASDDPRFNGSPHDIYNIIDNDAQMLLFITYLKQIMETENHERVLDYAYSFSGKSNDELLTEIRTMIGGFFHYDDEYGLENVVMFSPLFGHEEWKRYDDAIDYFENNGCDCTIQEKRWSCI